jgi:hypothetical protein
MRRRSRQPKNRARSSASLEHSERDRTRAPERQVGGSPTPPEARSASEAEFAGSAHFEAGIGTTAYVLHLFWFAMNTVLTRDRGLPARTHSTDILPPGALAGPWRIEHELGRGGMGTVYAVVHDGIGKRAALKVVHRHLVGADRTERILLEARVVNQVRHPNIVDIFETGLLEDGRPYIVMERLAGAPLSSRVQHNKLPADEVIAILLQICDALEAAHAAGVIHRDLKLDNVFIADDGSAKVLDWGIAKIVTTDLRQTLEGELVGTPQYLSPEQARGAAVTPQTDVYSLGVLAYELFLEQLPFEAETAAEIMVMHLRATPPSPRDAWPDIPDELDALLLAMLAKSPDKRPTMTGVAAALVATRSELERRRGLCAAASMPSILLARITQPRRLSHAELAMTADAGSVQTIRRRRWPIAAAAMAMAAALAVIWSSRGDDEVAPVASVIDAIPLQVFEAPPVPEAVIVPVVAPAVAPAIVPPVAAAAAAVVATPRHFTIKAPVRKPSHRDPNATVDAYR